MDIDFGDLFAKIGIARKAITDVHGKARGYQGKMVCPICEKGTLHYSCASTNGHIHAKCTTHKCVTWME